MAGKTFLKFFFVLVVGAGLFASGYFWAMKTMDQTPNSDDGANIGKTGSMATMPGMSGMEGMAPGMVMVSPEKQQLMGVRIATVERRPMVRTVRTVGTIT